MILLLGGTHETGAIARRLAQAGYQVLVSTATDEPLDTGAVEGGAIRRRVGRLDGPAMLALVGDQAVQVIVDATHPYAALARTIAPAVARQAGIPYVSFLRPGLEELRNLDRGPPKGPNPPAEIHLAANHEEAARIACSFGRPVLLTTGSQNLAPYVRQAGQSGLTLAVRVLPRDDSIQACLRAGVGRDLIIAAKGPFSVEENREHFRRFNVGVIVTKDSGRAGGVDAKLAAARLEGCQVVVVRRPGDPDPPSSASVDELLAAVLRAARRPPCSARTPSPIPGPGYEPAKGQIRNF